MAALPHRTLDALRAAGRTDADHEEATDVLAVQEVAAVCASLCDEDPVLDWVGVVVKLLWALEPSERELWDHVGDALRTFSPVLEGDCGRGVHCSTSQLLDFCDSADTVTICGQATRCAPRARDLVARFFRKRIEQGAFFRELRMTPVHFDELVARATPYLPIGA